MAEDQIPSPEIKNIKTPAVKEADKREKWTDNATSQKLINQLEKFVLNQNLDKGYKKLAADGISSSKRTLDSLLARNGGHQNLIGGESTTDRLQNKNYTLDANGRVCLVKNNSKETSRHQELLLLQRDTHELRCLREYLMLALEAIMHNHRQMMMKYVKKVNEKPRKVPQEAIENALKQANTEMVAEFAQMALAVDESIIREEIRANKRRKLKKTIEIETFLMRMMLEMEDIGEANAEDLVKLWNSHQRPSSATKPPSSPSSDPKEAAAGDALQ